MLNFRHSATALALALATAALLPIACDEDETVGPLPVTSEAIVGTWDLSRVDLQVTSTTSANGTSSVATSAVETRSTSATVAFAADGTKPPRFGQEMNHSRSQR